MEKSTTWAENVNPQRVQGRKKKHTAKILTPYSVYFSVTPLQEASNDAATENEVEDDDNTDGSDCAAWSKKARRELEMSVLEEIQDMEDRVCGASLQVKVAIISLLPSLFSSLSFVLGLAVEVAWDSTRSGFGSTYTFKIELRFKMIKSYVDLEEFNLSIQAALSWHNE